MSSLTLFDLILTYFLKKIFAQFSFMFLRLLVTYMNIFAGFHCAFHSCRRKQYINKKYLQVLTKVYQVVYECVHGERYDVSAIHKKD